MKSKKIVFLEEPTDQNQPKNTSQSIKKVLSLCKNFRETSVTKLPKQINQLPSVKMLSDKNTLNQKVRVLLVKDGFIIEKKYLVFEVQCTLVRCEEKYQEAMKENRQNYSESSVLDLNIQTNFYSIWQGLVKHNYAVQRDHKSYLEVKYTGYRAENISIQNKRIQFFQQSEGTKIDPNDVTLVNPISEFEQSYNLRHCRAELFYKNNPNIIRKSLSFCQTMESCSENQSFCSTYKNECKTPKRKSGPFPQFRKSGNQNYLKNIEKNLDDFSQNFFINMNTLEQKQGKKVQGSATDRNPNKAPYQSLEKSELSALLKGKSHTSKVTNLMKKSGNNSSFKEEAKKKRKAIKDQEKKNENLLIHSDYFTGSPGSYSNRNHAESLTEPSYGQPDVSFNRYGLNKMQPENLKKGFRF